MFPISEYEGPLREELVARLPDAMSTRAAVEGAVSDERVLDRKLCPTCRFPCSKSLAPPEIPGIFNGTDACNHINCPACLTSLCFVCMQPRAVRVGEGSHALCPSYDMQIALATRGTSWALVMPLTPMTAFATAAVLNTETGEFRVQDLLSPAAADTTVPGDPLQPAGRHAVVHVTRGIVTRVAVQPGDAPFRQVVCGRGGVRLVDEHGATTVRPDVGLGAMGMSPCDDVVVHMRAGVAHEITTAQYTGVAMAPVACPFVGMQYPLDLMPMAFPAMVPTWLDVEMAWLANLDSQS